MHDHDRSILIVKRSTPRLIKGVRAPIDHRLIVDQSRLTISKTEREIEIEIEIEREIERVREREIEIEIERERGEREREREKEREREAREREREKPLREMGKLVVQWRI